jgi:hypothetical protein
MMSEAPRQDLEMTSAALLRALEARGWRAAVVPAGRLADLRAEIECRRPEVSPAVMAVVDRNLCFTPPAAVAVPRSLIVVAMPHACARVTVVVAGETVSVPIPTTYCHHGEIQAEVTRAIVASLAPAALSAARMPLPEKLLAVCAGPLRSQQRRLRRWLGQLRRAGDLRLGARPGRRPLDRLAGASPLRNV